MSSSTSSSRAIYGRILFVTLLGMGIALVFVRLFTYANDVSGETILSRVLEAREALPRILAEDDDLVMVFGSSMVQAGFSARHFDAQLRNRGIDGVKSFNFGFGGLNPFFQDYLARRIRDTFEAEDRRLELAVLEFNPFQTTEGRWQGALPVVDSFLILLASPEEIWEITKDDPGRGVLMANIRYLRDGISAQMITHFFGDPLRESRPRSQLPHDEALGERLDEVGQQLSERFDEDYPDYVDSDWNYDWQGAGTILSERSPGTLELFEEYFSLLRNPRRMENDELNRISCCDIEELPFEEVLVEAYIRLVKVFQQFSNHVEVILLPRNTDWIVYTPEAQARLDALLDRIRVETGVVVKDFQVIDAITPEMYSDTTHLGRYIGDVPFTDFLVDEYGPILANR